MACGLALKRPLDLDGHLSPDTSIKRPRTTTAHCSPFRPTFFNSAAGSQVRNESVSPNVATTSFKSPFALSSNTQLTPQQLESYLTAEIRNLRRRRIIPKRKIECGGYRCPSPTSHSSDSDGEPGGSSPKPVQQKATNEKQFTFTQVQLICERLLKEQESRLRHQFESILTQRLAEQHETFVRFTQDQIQRKMDSNAEHLSYLS